MPAFAPTAVTIAAPDATVSWQIQRDGSSLKTLHEIGARLLAFMKH
jgi:hypothetical protein